MPIDGGIQVKMNNDVQSSNPKQKKIRAPGGSVDVTNM